MNASISGKRAVQLHHPGRDDIEAGFFKAGERGADFPLFKGVRLENNEALFHIFPQMFVRPPVGKREERWQG